MRTVHLVTHCYAVQIPDFAHLLTAQLSSLWLWPSQCRVKVTVFTGHDDDLTDSVMRRFARRLDGCGSVLTLETHYLSLGELFRRAVGRNVAAKKTTADVVYFADADYWFGAGAIDAISRAPVEDGKMYFPREVLLQKTHELGDREIRNITPGEVYEPDLSQYAPRRWGYAIGGNQIVSGNTARERGYLDGTKWVRPVKEPTKFLDTTCDRKYRFSLGGSYPLELPSIYRMRHSKSAFETEADRKLTRGHKSRKHG